MEHRRRAIDPLLIEIKTKLDTLNCELTHPETGIRTHIENQRRQLELHERKFIQIYTFGSTIVFIWGIVSGFIRNLFSGEK